MINVALNMINFANDKCLFVMLVIPFMSCGHWSIILRQGIQYLSANSIVRSIKWRVGTLWCNIVCPFSFSGPENTQRTTVYKYWKTSCLFKHWDIELHHGLVNVHSQWEYLQPGKRTITRLDTDHENTINLIFHRWFSQTVTCIPQWYIRSCSSS